jgi:hypothetical protein
MTDDLSRKRVEGGRKGGLAKVPKGASMLTPAERKEKARQAARARWSKHEN